MSTPLLTAAEAAEYLRLRPCTLAKYRSVGGGPISQRLAGGLFIRARLWKNGLPRALFPILPNIALAWRAAEITAS